MRSQPKILMEKSLRLFYTLWPDAETRRALVAVQASVSGRIVKPANLHLTMLFLGNQAEHLLPQLQGICDSIALPPMMLTIDQLGYFKRQKIAWAGMSAAPPSLHASRQALMACVEAQQVRFNDHPEFRPHITLARNASAPISAAIAPIFWQPKRIVLVASETDADAGGVQYRVLN